MRPVLPGLAAAALVLVAISARADDDDPFDGGADLPELSELPPLRALPPLRELAPLDAPAPASPPSEPAPVPAEPAHAPSISVVPASISVPAAPSATLGQSDEYRRSLHAYAIDTAPVSVDEYDRCVAAGRCARPTCTQAAGPVSCVDLPAAKAYCAFTGRRLPTEEEWEHAARDAEALGVRGTRDGRLEWTSSPYCYFCGKDDEVVRGGPTHNPGMRSWRPPTATDPKLGFRCAL